MKYEVKNHFTGAVQFVAEIDCPNDAPSSVKIGLAVKWGLASRADFSGADLSGADLSRADLSRADLSGADLSRADLSGADLSRADLSGAYLSGADLSGACLSGAYLIDAGQDQRGYRFWAWLCDGALILRGGCREWVGAEAARAHYSDGYASNGNRAECLAKIALIEVVAKSRGWI